MPKFGWHRTTSKGTFINGYQMCIVRLGCVFALEFRASLKTDHLQFLSVRKCATDGLAEFIWIAGRDEEPCALIGDDFSQGTDTRRDNGKTCSKCLRNNERDRK